ncbi:MAG: DUF3592 domain-containing protein [Bacteroidota bacterium]
MKKVLLIAAAIILGFFIQKHRQDRANEIQAKATVMDIQKVKNTRKGDKPFVYKIDVRFENEFDRVQKSSFISRRLPSYRRGEVITINYNANNPTQARAVKKKYAL